MGWIRRWLAGTPFDDIAYWLTLGSVYFLVGVLFFYSGEQKLFKGHGAPPAAIKQQFQGTFLDTWPGIDAIWWILSILEFSIFVVLAVSLLLGEFLPSRRKRVLLIGLSLALFTFACLSFGQTATGGNASSLYTYFGSTAIIVLLVLLLPPNRPRAWLSGLVSR